VLILLFSVYIKIANATLFHSSNLFRTNFVQISLILFNWLFHILDHPSLDRILFADPSSSYIIPVSNQKVCKKFGNLITSGIENCQRLSIRSQLNESVI